MKRVMLDLESLSSSSNATIVSIGAVEFDEAKPFDLGKEFYKVVSLSSQLGHGRDIDPDTCKWWMNQSEAARAVFKEPGAPAHEALTLFNWYLGDVAGEEDVELWGNGSDFDCVVIANACAAYDVKKSWKFRGHRCFRTLKNLGLKLAPGEGCERSACGPHHNALADAKYQAIYAGLYLRRIAEMQTKVQNEAYIRSIP